MESLEFESPSEGSQVHANHPSMQWERQCPELMGNDDDNENNAGNDDVLLSNLHWFVTVTFGRIFHLCASPSNPTTSLPKQEMFNF